MSKNFVYKGSRTNEISFPLGGIGTGSIGLAGNGRLIDWELFNRPNKLSCNGFSFFAVKAENASEVKAANVLNGNLQKQFTGSGKAMFRDFGFGVERESMAGMPHFERSTFIGEFPIAEMQFEDRKVPLKVTMKAFNPFIPLNAKDSSLPAAIFEFEVVNEHYETLDISLTGCLANPFAVGALNRFEDLPDCKGMRLTSTAYGDDSPEYGELFLSTDGEDVSYQHYWYRGGWFDNLTVFWKDFCAPGKLKDRQYDRAEQSRTVFNSLDVCSLASRKTVAPGASARFRFAITWHFPNFVNYWNPGALPAPSWKNYYATLFADASDSAAYVWRNLPRLRAETLAFKEALFRSALPAYVIDAVSANLSTLKSPTVVRLTDGSLYGFEGCHPNSGCCEGSCAHVWNYEQATAFLFPELARGMRELDYKANQLDNGKVFNRMMLPIERTKPEGDPLAAVDGQLGGIIKVYREWKMSGDGAWLKKMWLPVKKALAYVWHPDNEYGWDRDADGVIEGRQHHTLDDDLYGPSAYITGLYHTALRAAAEMAAALGDADGAYYNSLYEQGRAWVDANLFNGEYFHQLVDLRNPKYPVDPELGELKYQIGEGCHIDQLLGQWHAHNVGLGYVFDPDKVRTALKSLFKYNFVTLGDYANACRIYALNDEQGLLMCTWPKNNSPLVPIPYADECMNGFEYQAACHMIYEGLLEEGLQIVKAVRDRYDGAKRNPWNEFECGSNYARSMASYALLPALGGFEYDMRHGHIGFHPKMNRERFRTFWCIGSAWGQFVCGHNALRLEVLYGELTLRSFASDMLPADGSVRLILDRQRIEGRCDAQRIVWERPIVLRRGQTLHIEI